MAVSAPASMNTTTRFPLSMSEPRVGQSDCLTGGAGGTYAIEDIPKINAFQSGQLDDLYRLCSKNHLPESSKAGLQKSCKDTFSGLVKMKVITSLGLASSHVFTVLR